MKNLFKDAKFDIKQGWRMVAEFDKDYIVDVKNYCKVHGGKLYISLRTSLSSYGSSYDKNGKMYFPEVYVEYVLDQIRKFKKHGEWEVVK